MKKTYTPTYSYQDVEITDHKILYESIFRIDQYRFRFKLYNGSWSHVVDREIFERGNSVAILPYDPILDKVILIEQFRVGAIHAIHDKQSPWLLEIVAGIIDKQEFPEQTARRELIEEAGLTTLDLIPIMNYWVSPGGSTEKTALFCAKVDANHAQGIFGLAEEMENIKVISLPTDEALEILNTKNIFNVSAIIALQWLQINRINLKKHWHLS